MYAVGPRWGREAYVHKYVSDGTRQWAREIEADAATSVTIGHDGYVLNRVLGNIG